MGLTLRDQMRKTIKEIMLADAKSSAVYAREESGKAARTVTMIGIRA